MVHQAIAVSAQDEATLDDTRTGLFKAELKLILFFFNPWMASFLNVMWIAAILFVLHFDFGCYLEFAVQNAF